VRTLSQFFKEKVEAVKADEQRQSESL